MTVLNPLQQTIYQVLSADSNLAALVTGIFDRTVQDTAFPYVTFGDMSADDWSTATTDGFEQQFILDVWSREGGRRQAVSIMEHVYGLLHDTNPAVTGYTLVSLRLRSSGILLESDGWTYHGMLKFRALLQQN